jgi:hypothetical protein
VLIYSIDIHHVNHYFFLSSLSPQPIGSLLRRLLIKAQSETTVDSGAEAGGAKQVGD